MKKRLILSFVGFFGIALISIVLTGCPSNNQVTLPPPGTVPVGTLYTANGTTSGVAGDGVISIYKLPLSSASTPVGSFTVPGTPDLNGICTDAAGRLFVPDDHNNVVQVYTPPIGSGATPAFTLSLAAGAIDCAFDSAGNLYVVGGSTTAAYTAPVQSGSTPARTISSGMVSPFGAGTDMSGNLYVSQSTNNTSYSNYAGGNTLSATFGTNIDDWGEIVGPDTKLYVSNGTTLGDIDVFTTPVSNAQTRSSHFTVPGTNGFNAFYIKFDAAGNMYVAARTAVAASELVVLAPPFTGASLATLTSGQQFGFEGVAIGP